VNDSVHPIYSGPDWGTMTVMLDGMFDLSDLSTWTINGDAITLEFPFAIREGYHELYIEIADTEWNWAWYSGWFTVNSVVDMLTAEFADPVSGDPIANGQTVAMTEVTVRGYTEPSADVDIITPTGMYSMSADGSGYYEWPDVALSEGANVVTVIATNDAGVTKSQSMMIFRDTICMLWVAGVPSPTADPVLELSGWTDAGAMVTVDGVNATMNPDGTWTASVSLSEGANSIMVEATDALGNTKLAWVDVELDTTPPGLVIVSPADGSNTSEPSVTVSGTTDVGATVMVNGVLASDGTADWSATVVLSEGMNTITVTAEDDLGNSVSTSIVVEYIPPVYVTPEELAAAMAVLEGELSNLSADMAALEAMLMDEISNLSADLAAAVATLESNMSALNATLIDEIAELNASLLAEITDLQAQIDQLNTDLADAVADLEDQMDSMNDALLSDIAALQDMIDDLEALLASEVTDLQGQIDDLVDDLAEQVEAIQQQIDAIGTDIDDIQDDMSDLEDSLSDDIGNVEQKAEDTDAFASMLMYLTILLFVIALVLVGLVWFLMSRKMGGSGGSASSMEEVDETPSEVEKEFEALEKEIKQEEL